MAIVKLVHFSDCPSDIYYAVVAWDEADWLDRKARWNADDKTAMEPLTCDQFMNRYGFSGMMIAMMAGEVPDRLFQQWELQWKAIQSIKNPVKDPFLRSLYPE